MKKTKEQEIAINNIEGNAIIIAGAGSGKTEILSERIAKIIKEKRAEPWEILALTFTNKAARELKGRVNKKVGESAKKIWAGTFHSTFAKILRIDGSAIGLKRNYTIYDQEDSLNLFKKIIKELDMPKEGHGQEIKKIIKKNDYNNNKNELTPEKVSRNISAIMNKKMFNADDFSLYIKKFEGREETKTFMKRIEKVYQEYEKRLKDSMAIDFDSILLRTHELFKNEEIVSKYQKQFKFIIIDEFQDTNKLQYEIVKKLSLLHNNICVIGDDAQSIYSFRCAQIENILNFDKEFKDVKKFTLTQNFRSSKKILNKANNLIKNNSLQIKKELFTNNEEGNNVVFKTYKTDLKEARGVSKEIKRLLDEGEKPNDIIILYRTHKQNIVFEKALREEKIPYLIKGKHSFFDRKEIKDIICYMRFLVNENDEEAFNRIIAVPRRGIGLKTLDEIRSWGKKHQIKQWQSLKSIEKIIKNPQKIKIIKEFTKKIEELREESKNLKVTETIRKIIEEFSILEFYEEEEKRCKNIEYFVENIDEKLNEENLSSFLEKACLQNYNEEEEKNKVTLASIHGVKGLEFKNVFLVGLEEEILPFHTGYIKKDKLEEERRLFYVAITRAMKYLHISNSQLRVKFERYVSSPQSRFLREIGF